jgi:hypothetical protein
MMSDGMTTEVEEGGMNSAWVVAPRSTVARRHQKKWWRLGQRPGGVRQTLGLAQGKDQALITMLVERDCRGIS